MHWNRKRKKSKKVHVCEFKRIKKKNTCLTIINNLHLLLAFLLFYIPGFSKGLIRMPLPRSNRLHPVCWMVPKSFIICTQSNKLNVNLCFSNNPRQTLMYTNSVTKAFKLFNLVVKSLLLPLFSIHTLNNFLKYANEYWYL